MAIELPTEVAFFLNMCGIPYPDVNEDDVRALAQHVRTFAAGVKETHESATGVIKDMNSVYSGYSYEQLVSAWAAMSNSHMAALDTACKVVAKALEIAAEVITVVKVAVLTELAALAAAYAAAMAMPPLAPTGPPIALAARGLCDQMQQALIGYIVAEVLGKAIEPLEQTIDDMIKGVVYDAARDALGVPPPDSSAVIPLRIDPDEVQQYAKVLDDHADDIMKHAATFAENVSALDFTTPTGFDDTAYPATPDHRPVPTTRVTPTITEPSGPGLPPESTRGIAGPPSADRPGTISGTGDTLQPTDGRQYADAPGSVNGRSGQPGAHPEQPSSAAAHPNTVPGQPGEAAATAPASVRDVAGGADSDPVNPSPTATASAVNPPNQHPAEITHFPGRFEGAQAIVDAPSAALGEQVPPVVGSDAQQPLPTSDPAVTGTPPAIDRAFDNSAGTSSGPTVGRAGAGMSATPWARNTKRSVPAKPALPKIVRPFGSRPAAIRKPADTPWSKAHRTRAASPISAPATNPSPRHRREKTAEQDAAEDVAQPTPIRVEASGPPRVAPPAVTPPEIDVADRRPSG